MDGKYESGFHIFGTTDTIYVLFFIYHAHIFSGITITKQWASIIALFEIFDSISEQGWNPGTFYQIELF